MGYQYKYRQTLVLLKNKYPENLFFCKKKIKKYNYFFKENHWIIKRTKKNLALCCFQQYCRTVQQQLKKGKKKVNSSQTKNFSESKNKLMNNNLDLLYKRGLLFTRSVWAKPKLWQLDTTCKGEPGEPLLRLPSNERDKKVIVLYTSNHLYSKLLFHGSGYKRLSYFFEKIRERKKLKILYGYYNRKYLQKQFKASAKYNLNSRVSTISIFEFNINFILCRSGFYPHIQKAEQMIQHGHYLLNNKNIFSTHMEIKSGDVISIKKKNYSATICKNKFAYTFPPFVRLPGGRIRHQRWSTSPANLFHKKLSVETNKLKYRYLSSEILLNYRKTFYILQKFNKDIHHQKKFMKKSFLYPCRF